VELEERVWPDNITSRGGEVLGCDDLEIADSSRFWVVRVLVLTGAGVSASSTGYVDYTVSTLDDQGDRAPSILLTAGVGAAEPSTRVGRRTISDLVESSNERQKSPWIEGPLRWCRQCIPPTFRIDLHGAAATGVTYAVEVAADLRCFKGRLTRAELLKETYYHSGWLKCLPLQASFRAYTLPMVQWRTLLAMPRLYYRLIIRSAKNEFSEISSIQLVKGAQSLTDEQEPHYRQEEARWRFSGNGLPRKQKPPRARLQTAHRLGKKRKQCIPRKQKS